MSSVFGPTVLLTNNCVLVLDGIIGPKALHCLKKITALSTIHVCILFYVAFYLIYRATRRLSNSFYTKLILLFVRKRIVFVDRKWAVQL